jgi:RimJ/RimL family protein N-acetyltransferase
MATNPDFKKVFKLLLSIIADSTCKRWYHRRMIPVGTTERLILRPLEMADAAQIQELFPQWEIVKYMHRRIPWPYPPDGARQFLRDIAIPQAERGYGWQWSIRLRTEPAQLMGVIGLMKDQDTNRGFWLGLPWHGLGYMSEACVWVNDFWFETLGFPVLRVAKAIANTASRRISEKQGMRIVEVVERDYVCGRVLSELWEITAEEWHEWKSGWQSRVR